MKLRTHLAALAALATLTLLSSVPAAHAQTLGMDFTGGASDVAGFVTYGYSFTTSTASSLTGLGVFDLGNNGLAEAHQVGLWNSAGTLLASTTMAAGTGANQNIVSGSGKGSWRVNNIAPLSLASGTYTLGAYYASGADGFIIFATTAPASGVTYGGALAGSGSFTRPTDSANGLNAGFFGPTFVIGSAAPAVPEPGSVALLVGMGISGAGFLARRRRSARRTA